MGRNIIPFSEAQATFECRHHNPIGNNPVSAHYYEELIRIRDSLKQVAQQYNISLKEAMIDITYIAVGDEIVTQLTEGQKEN